MFLPILPVLKKKKKKDDESCLKFFFVYFPDESLINGERSMTRKSFKIQVCSHERCKSNYVGGGFHFFFDAFYFDRYGNIGTEAFQLPKFKSVMFMIN